MGRAPCCDKANVKKGPWSPEEDARLKAYIEQHGTGGNWIALPQKIGLKRCGKSCRLRWLNYLRPNIKHGDFSEEEDNIICSLYISIGSRWSLIAAQLPGRTDNDIKNYWNTRLKKKLQGKQRKEQQAQARRVSSVKQEMKRETKGYCFAELCTSKPLPTASIKVGGRFSGDHHQSYTSAINSQYPYDTCFPQDLLHPTSMNMMNPEAVVTSANNGSTSQLTNIFQGFGNLPSDWSEFICVTPQSYHITNESSSWGPGDMSSLVYSPLVSDYEACHHEMPQDVAFEEGSYIGCNNTSVLYMGSCNDWVSDKS